MNVVKNIKVQITAELFAEPSRSIAFILPQEIVEMCSFDYVKFVIRENVDALRDSIEKADVQNTFTSVDGFIVLDAATSWMPLPDPPKEDV